MKKVIGVTGGIASGKSNIIKLLGEMGFYTLSADLITKELSFIGMPIYEKIKQEFGKEYLTPTGNLDRNKLANLIFSNDEARKKLNDLSHPIIRETLEKRINTADYTYIFIEVPLLFEAKFDDLCEDIICVYLPFEIQRERLALRDNLTLEEAEIRIKTQMPLSEKANLSDYVIDSSGDFSETKDQLLKILERIFAENE